MKNKNRNFFTFQNGKYFLVFLCALFCLLGAKNASAAYTASYYNLLSAVTSPEMPSEATTPDLTRTDNEINFDWGESSPAPGTINTNGFVARWTETKYLAAGNYIFTATSDDGVRVYIDNTLIINDWVDRAAATSYAYPNISGGSHTIKVEYYENSGGAVCQFSYRSEIPYVSDFAPADGATNIDTNTNLVIKFSEAIYVDSGNIVIKKSSDNSTIETIDVASAKVSGNGTDTITINPSITLDDNTGYYAQIDSTAFACQDGYYYAGISDATTWNFTTGNYNDPVVKTLTPGDNVRSMAMDGNLVIKFSDIVDVETGNIVIKKSSDDSTVETISVTSSQVTGSGTDTITINPNTELVKTSWYYVQIDSIAFDDTGGRSFAGIADATSWNFETRGTVSTPYAWIASYNNNTISKIDILTGNVLGTYNTGANPKGVAVDLEGNVWVTNYSSNNVTKLDVEGNLVGTYAVGTNPAGIVIDATGSVWVANGQSSGTISKLDPSGNLLGTFTLGAGAIGQYRSLAVDADNNIWVAYSTYYSKITKMDSSGKILATYNFNNSYTGAYSIFADASNIYVSVNEATLKLDTSGTVLRAYGLAGAAQITVDAFGNVWERHYNLSSLRCYDSNLANGVEYWEAQSVQGLASDAYGFVWAPSGDDNTLKKLNLNESFSPLASYSIASSPRAIGDFTGYALQRFTLGYAQADIAGPVVETLSPSDDSANVATDANLVIHFDEGVNVKTGNMYIRKVSDNSIVERIAIESDQVTGSGTDTITINPSVTLEDDTQYYATVDSIAVDDLYGHSFTGIVATTVWNFTTGDFTGPGISSLTPSDDATDANIDSDFVMHFTENVDVESGNITIKKASDNSTVETIDVASGQVTGSGTDTITINPSVTLDENTGYYVQVDATALDDAAGNSFAGISDATSWNFTAKTYSIDDGLLVHWKLDGDGNDSSGNGKNLTIIGSSFSSEHTSTSSNTQSINLDGDDDHAVANGSLNGSSIPISESFWIKSSAPPATLPGWIMALSSNGDFSVGYANGVYLDTSGRPLYYNWNGSAAVLAQGTTNVADGSWHNIITTYDGMHMRLYVDGNQEGGDVDFVTTDTWNYIPVLAYGHAGFSRYQGLLDDVRIYDRALSAANISNISDVDNIAPTVSMLTPADDATSFTPDSDLVIKFSEAVNTGSGNVVIKKSSDNSTVETISAAGAQVSGGGTDTITINPSSNLEYDTGYYVQIDATAFDDAAGNGYAGISNTTAWNFSTKSSLVAHWKFDDSLADSSGNGNTFTAEGDTSYNSDYPHTSFTNTKSLDFYDDNYAATGSSSVFTNLSGTQPFTQSLWIKTTTKADAGNKIYVTMMTANGQDDGLHDKGIYIDSSGYINFFTYSSFGAYVNTTKDVTDGAWHHITATYDGSKMRLYVDGTQYGGDVLASGTYVENCVVLSFQMSSDSTFQSYTGQLDDVRIYNKALSQDEINVLKTYTPTYTLNYHAESGGTISGDSSQTVEEGANGTEVTAIANDGYQFVEWSDHIVTAARTDADVTSNLDVTASFEDNDTTAPVIESLTPADDATDVATNANLVIHFSEPVYIGSGNIYIKSRAGETSEMFTVDATTAISGDGTDTITMNPYATLYKDTEYYVQMDAGVFHDANGNPTAEISDSATWNFFTIEPGTSDEISSCEQFKSDIEADPDGEYILTDDLDCSSLGNDIMVNFTGTFDGDGHSITVDIDNSADTWGVTGLFQSAPRAEIKNLTLNGRVIGRDMVGAFVGSGSANFENCINNASVSGREYEGSFIGIGSSPSSIYNSVNNGNVTCSNSMCGGFFGVMSGDVTISESVNNGDVSGLYYGGGFIGFYDGNLEVLDSYNSGNISAATGDVGGIIGYGRNGSMSLSNVYNSGDISGNSGLGGLIGEADSSLVSLADCYNSADLSGSSYAGGLVGKTNVNISEASNVFSVGKITGDDSGILFGEISGIDDASGLYAYDIADDSATACESADTVTCDAIIDDSNGSLDYFKTDSNVPISAWSKSFWTFVDGYYPFLSWQEDIPDPIDDEEDQDDSEDNPTPILQKAKIISWDAYKYTDANKTCSERLKIEIDGRHFAKDAQVFIGGHEASSIDRKNSKKIVAKFCLEKLLRDMTDHKRVISVKNPDTDETKADKQIDLENIEEENAQAENANVQIEISRTYSGDAKPNACSYSVQDGDNLWTIAKKVYGDATAYPLIIESNKDQHSEIIFGKLSINEELTFDCASQDGSNSNQEDNTSAQSENKTVAAAFKWWNPMTWF